MSDVVSFQIRLPMPVRDWLKEKAERDFRSMNGQMVAILQEAMVKDKQRVAA